MKKHSISAVCPHCETPMSYERPHFFSMYKTDYWNALLDLSLFSVTCTNCKKKFYHFPGTLLVDHHRRFIVYFAGIVTGGDILLYYLEMLVDSGVIVGETMQKRRISKISGINPEQMMQWLRVEKLTMWYLVFRDYMLEKYTDGYTVEYSKGLNEAIERVVAHKMDMSYMDFLAIRKQAAEMHNNERERWQNYRFIGAGEDTFLFKSPTGAEFEYPKADFSKIMENKDGWQKFYARIRDDEKKMNYEMMRTVISFLNKMMNVDRTFPPNNVETEGKKEK